MPTYVNTQQIDAQVLAALQAEAENVTKGMAAAAKESPQKDLFDMSKSWFGVHWSFCVVWMEDLEAVIDLKSFGRLPVEALQSFWVESVPCLLE